MLQQSLRHLLLFCMELRRTEIRRTVGIRLGQLGPSFSDGWNWLSYAVLEVTKTFHWTIGHNCTLAPNSKKWWDLHTICPFSNHISFVVGFYLFKKQLNESIHPNVSFQHIKMCPDSLCLSRSSPCPMFPLGPFLHSPPGKQQLKHQWPQLLLPKGTNLHSWCGLFETPGHNKSQQVALWTKQIRIKKTWTFQKTWTI